MKPRVLFVSPSRYRLPLDPALARKWDALAEELDVRVLASGDGGDATFHLDRDHGLAAYYATLAYRIAREARAFRPDVIVAQSPYEALAARPVRGRAKVLLEIHGDWDTASRLYGSRARVLLEPVSRPLARSAVRSADAVRTLSPYTSSLVRAVDVEPAAEFVAYADASAFTSRPRAPLPETPSALFVGVLERYKNIGGLSGRVAARRRGSARGAAAHRRERPRDGDREAPRGAAERRVVAANLGSRGRGRARRSECSSPAVVLRGSAARRDRGIRAWTARRRSAGRRDPDIVRDGINGILVDPRDPASIAAGVLRVLGDRALLEQLAGAAAGDAERWLQTPEDFARQMRELVERMT